MLILNFVLCLKSINLLDHFTDCQRIWNVPSPGNHRTGRDFRRNSSLYKNILSPVLIAAPSIEIGYPRPFAAMIPAFVPRLLVKAICNFVKSLSQTSWQVHFELLFFPAGSRAFPIRSSFFINSFSASGSSGLIPTHQ